MTSPLARPGAFLHAILAAIATVALGVPALIVANPPVIPPPVKRVARAPQRVVPAAELPPVEPMKLVDLAPEDARSFNATVPFSTEPNPAARPFRFAGGPEDQARAVDCLAAGVLYEAGDDAVGERAVAQVILNRLRHPAFPKTVCGVVFQGQERRTGCQFTFTCDGALARPPSEDGWRRAREIATAALSGAVYKPVGHATHYHTDWVVPYWSSSLDKIVEVHTHLFFRWSGWWGTPPAFNRRVSQEEPVIAKIAAWSEAHRAGAVMDEAEAAFAEAMALTGGAAQPVATEENSFLVTLPPDVTADEFPALATFACDERPYCKYLAWTDTARTPRTLPLDAGQVATMAFSYLRDRAAGYEKGLWNCRQFKRAVPTQCMKVQAYTPGAPTAPDAAPSPAPRGPETLGGVRFRLDPAPRPTPSPTSRPSAAATPSPTARPRPPGTSPAATP